MDSNKPWDGLTHAQVQERTLAGLSNAQPNNLTKATKDIIIDNVFTVFNLLNVAIAIALLLVQAYLNMFFIGVVVLNTLIGIVQEIRAKKALEKLSLLASKPVITHRDGEWIPVQMEQLVLDDIVQLQAGDQIMSDAIVVEGVVEVNEALLTGEADPLHKGVHDALLSGSFIVSGKCVAKVEKVGVDNYATKISIEAKAHKKLHSDLLHSINTIVTFTSYFILPFGLLLFFNTYVLGSAPLQESVVSTSAALLGMLPKGLVLLTTVALVIAVLKLTLKKILVQELYCIEMLARVDTICFDKTGTLTQGKMVVQRVEELVPFPQPLALLLGCLLGKSVDNNATMLALREHFPTSDALAIDSMLPFSSERKYSKAMFSQLGSLYLGAPDILLAATGQAMPQALQDLQHSGDRLLLVGLDVSGNEAPTHFSSLGLLVLQDPLREDAEKIITFFKEEDIAIKIISGDHPATVATIAHQAGVQNALDYVDATTLVSEEDVVDAVQRYTVFGRVLPKQKQQLIKAMKQLGHNVAMSGDGVNDVLALKESDCSIAIANGSQAASQVSQLVLLDSDFSNVPLVLREGRRVVNNIQRSASLFLVKTMFSFMLTLLAILLGFPYPFMPIQLSLISNFIEGFPAFFLQLEPNNERVSGSFLKTVFDNGFPTALLIVAYVLLTHYVFAPALNLDAVANNTLSFYLMGMAWLMQLFHVCRPFSKLRIALWLASFVGFYASAFILGSWIGLGPLPTAAWMVFLVLSLATYPIQLLLSALNHKVQAWLTPVLARKKSK